MTTTEGHHTHGRHETESERIRRQMDAIARPAEWAIVAMLAVTLYLLGLLP